MKRYFGILFAVLSLAAGATTTQSRFQLTLPCLASMKSSVTDVRVIYTINSIGLTNTLTSSSYTTASILADGSGLVEVTLKPGYTNARFAYVTEAYDTQTSQSGVIASGSTIPAYTAGNYPLLTSITNLLVDPMTFTLTLNANGGRVSPSSLKLTYDTTYGAATAEGVLPEPVREGYLFKGWWGEGTSWTGTETVKTLTNQTFTAAWQPVTYTVRYNPTEGSGSMADQSFTYDESQTLSPCTFTRDNYVFSCWSNTVTGATYSDGQQVLNLTNAQDAVVSLNAVWAAKSYSFHYHTNFGTDVDKSVSVSYGAKVELDSALSRLGYEFQGWSSDPASPWADYSANQLVDTTDMAFSEQGEIHFYAVWMPYAYTVTFAANGGTGTMDVQERQYDDGLPLSDCIFTRTGYVFNQWQMTTGYKVAAGVTNNLVAPTKDGVKVALKALWSPIAYTIVFAPNDEKATGEMDALDLTYDTPQALSTCAFEKDGYDFLGWARSADGDVEFQDGATVTNLSVTAGDAVTLYARWKAQSYTVVLDANGGVFGTQANDPATSNLTVTVDQPYGAFPAVTNLQPKLVFGDWRTAGGAVVTETDLVPAPSAGVTNLVATWVKDDPLARAVDAEELDFSQSAANALDGWVEVKNTAEASDGDAACAIIAADTGYDSVKMTTQVVGSGTLTFQWKILSYSQPVEEETAKESWGWTPERLVFDVGSTRLRGLAGSSTLFYHATSFTGEDPVELERRTTNPGWVEETIRIDAAPGVTNTLVWTFDYMKDDPTPGKAWVNAVKWVPRQGTTLLFR